MLKPVNADVYLHYRCANCDFIHIITIAETRFPAKILCYCGEKLFIEPIKQVTVTPVYGTKKDKVYIEEEKTTTNEHIQPKTTINKPAINSVLFDDSVSALISLGVKKMVAREQVGKLLKTKQCVSVEEVIREICK